jgi:DNA polymerase-1
MNQAIDIYRSIVMSGVGLTLQDDSIIIEGSTQPDENVLQLIRDNKPALIEILQRRKPCGYITNKDGLFEIESHIYEKDIRRIYIDTETTGLNPHQDKLVTIQINTGDKFFLVNVGIIRTGQEFGYFYYGIKTIFEDNKILKIGHNLKFDLKFLEKHLFNRSFNPVNIFDTCIAEHLLTAGIAEKGDHRLDSVVRKYTGQELPKDQQKTFKYGEHLTSDQFKYALNDVEALVPVFERQKTLLQESGLLQTALMEFSIIPAVAKIELTGMFIDQQALTGITEKLEIDRSTSERTLNELTAGLTPESDQLDLFTEKKPKINFASPVQVKRLFESIGIELESTDTKTLGRINNPIAKELVNFRKLNKLITSFAAKLPGHVEPSTGRIHPDFHQMGTETGRFTCSNPNLQQMPHDQTWRDLFIAEPGNKIITADYSQIELRILAEFSQDPVFLKAFKDGLDLHRQTASQIFNTAFDQVTKDQRNAAKAINFGLVYGMASTGLSARLNISEEEAEIFINKYFRAYPAIKNCLQNLGMKAVKDGFSLTPLGRKRFYHQVDSFSGQKSRERQGRNTPIQSTCGDILKTAIQLISPELYQYESKITNLVHDELVFEVPEEHSEPVKEMIKDRMIKAGERFIKSIPVEVDICIDTKWKK